MSQICKKSKKNLSSVFSFKNLKKQKKTKGLQKFSTLNLISMQQNSTSLAVMSFRKIQICQFQNCSNKIVHR